MMQYLFSLKASAHFDEINPIMYIFTFVSNHDSLDWKDYDAATIISKVCNHESLDNGSIILCHNGAKHTADALDDMLTNLKNQGYEIVPISELIIREDFHMDVTGMQIAD